MAPGPEKYFLLAGSELSQLLDPAKDAGKEREGWAGGPAWPFSGPGTVHVTYGERSFTQRQSQNPPKPLQASERILDTPPPFLLLFSPRWVLTHQRNAVRIQRASGPSSYRLSLPAFGHPMEWPF